MSGFFSLSGQVALVTGGGQGIGAAIARRFERAGARVAVFDADGPNAEAVASEVGGVAAVGVVRSEADVIAALEKIAAALGQVSILVNNAGITGRCELSGNLTPDELRTVLDVNVLGPFLFCRAAVPGMLARGYGRIINMASVADKEGNPTLVPYSASKAALIAMTKSLAKEVAGMADVTVNAVAPAVIRTPILDDMAPETIDSMVGKIPMGRVGTVDEVAALVRYLASAEASFTTGQCYDISGGRATY